MIIRPSSLVRELLLAEHICQPYSGKPWWCTTVRMPDGVGVQDDIVTVVDREDVDVGRYVTDSNYTFDVHLRIVVRGVGYDECYEKIREITDTLEEVQDYPVVYKGDEYLLKGFKKTSSIQYSGLDETKRRHIHTIEYDLVLT